MTNQPIAPAVRRATLADLDGIIALRALCYPHAPYQEEALRRRLTQNPRFNFADDVLVVAIDGEIVGMLILIPFEAHAPGGQTLPMRGVASVAVSPLYRRRGVAGALLKGALEAINASGAAIAALYPFEYAFYNRYGWAAVARACRYQLSAQSLPLFEERAGVRRLGVGDLPLVQRCHEAERSARGDLAVARSLAFLEERWQTCNLHGFGYPASGDLEGYVLFEFAPVAELPLQQDLLVQDLTVATPAAWKGLLGTLAAMQEQLRDVVVSLPPGDPFPLLWQEQRQPRSPMVRGEDFAVGQCTTSFMLRLIDVPAALAGRGYPPLTGSLSIRLSDRYLRDNQGPLTLRLIDGRAEIELHAFISDRWIECDVDTLAQLWCGAVSASEARRWGKLNAANDETLAWADAIFRTSHPPLLADLDVF